MKKSTIIFNFDEEKSAALRMFLSQKDLTLEDELLSFAEELFEKHVPRPVREYLTLKVGGGEKPPKKAAEKRSEQASGAAGNAP